MCKAVKYLVLQLIRITFTTTTVMVLFLLVWLSPSLVGLMGRGCCSPYLLIKTPPLRCLTLA